MEPRRCTPEESELLKVTLIKKKKISFDQSTSVISILLFLYFVHFFHGYEGMWDVKVLFLPLSVYVCVTHV